jgi:hypothetical protein
MCAIGTLGACSIEDVSRLTESIAIPTPDPIDARNKDVAWIYHLSKVHQEAPLLARLQREHDAEAASPLPGVTPSAAATLATAAPTARPTPSVAPSTSASASATAAASPARSAGPSAAASSNASPAGSPSPSPTPRLPVDPALSLALFHIDSSTYRSTFVDNYPIDSAGVDGDYGTRLARAKLTKQGIAYPILALAGYAEAGDAVATTRLLAATAVSSGSQAAAYADADAAVASRNPDGFADALAALSMGIRMRVASTSHWCALVPKTFLAATDPDPGRIAMQTVIRRALADCGRDRRSSRHRGKPRKRGATHVSKKNARGPA